MLTLSDPEKVDIFEVLLRTVASDVEHVEIPIPGDSSTWQDQGKMHSLNEKILVGISRNKI